MNIREKILIVDDNIINIEVLTEILQDEYEVQSADCADGALKVLTSYKPDVMLLDVMMPGMDGYELCRKVRENEKYKFMKIILVSGKAMLNDRLKGYQSGADDYIVKPFDPNEIIAKIKVFLKFKNMEEINKIKNDLICLFSHETRTPLNGIIGLSEILLDDNSLSDEVKDSIASIHESGMNLFSFVEKTELLISLKNRRNISLLTNNLVPILTEVCLSLKEFALNKSVKITNLIPSDEILLESDKELLHKLFYYLIHNAIKFSHNNSEVVINLNKEQNDLIFEIKDNGIGIPQIWFDNVFDEFSIQDVSHHQKGQGLSLSIGKYIAEIHNANIYFDSEENKGSTFYIKFSK